MLILTSLIAVIPLAVGVWLYFTRRGGRARNVLLLFSVLLPGAFVILSAVLGIRGEALLFRMTQNIRILCRVDTLGLFFAILASVAFFLVAVYGIGYFHGDTRKQKFDCFFLLTYGTILLLCFAGNLLTMYVCFEAVTLCSMPMVLHDKTKESVDAALKYLLYSVGGAFLGFIGIVYFSVNSAVDGFALGGVLKSEILTSPAFSVILFLMLVGFGAKCGMFPLHNWLPTAHPVAPAPASALLSGIVTKSGIIAVLRIVYFTVGAENVRSTWVHSVWIVLIMVTVLLGSSMAVVQKNFKKRLAFSTVSQVSYVLLGISVLSEDGLCGAMLQTASHATVKIGLFWWQACFCIVLIFTTWTNWTVSGNECPSPCGATPCFPSVLWAFLPPSASSLNGISQAVL